MQKRWIMNIIDKKIKHVKYLYEKRVIHNQRVEEQNIKINSDYVSKSIRLKEIGKKKNKIFGLCVEINMTLFAIIFLVFNAPVGETEYAMNFFAIAVKAFSPMILSFVSFFLSFKISTKNKKYKELIQEETKLTSQMQLEENKMKRLQDHLMKSNQEVERLQQLLQDFEREREALKIDVYHKDMYQLIEQTWENYCPSQADLARFNCIHENSKRGKQKVLK